MAREFGPSGETIESKAPHCPMCDRPLESINDYPQIMIKDVVISRIPNYVRNMPEEDNISGKIKGFSKRPEVIDYIQV